MNTHRVYTLFLSIALFALSACERVENLSDSVNLTEFAIVAHSPAEIELGTPTIEGDTVFIPVLRGISLFPLSMHAIPAASSETKQILPGSSYSSFEDITFRSGDIDDKVLYLVAKSGLTKAYHIKLKVAPQNVQSDFKDFNILSTSEADVFSSPHAYINPITAQIDIYMFPCKAPISITAAATLADNAILQDAALQELNSSLLTLDYQSLNDTITYRVEAQSGKVQYWNVCLKEAKPTADDTPSNVLAAVTVQTDKLKAESQTEGYTVSSMGVDADAGMITFSVSSADFSAFSILPEIELPANSQLVGYKPGEPLLFTSYNTTYDFYILDNRTGYHKKWTFSITFDDVTDVHKFPFTYHDASVAGDQIILSDEAYVDNINNTVTLWVTKLNPSYFPLNVTPGDIVVSELATTDIGEMVFADMKDTYHFKVSGVVNDEDWTVVLKPVPTIGTEAEIEDFRIVSSTLAWLTDKDVTINRDKAEIIIDIAYNNRYMDDLFSGNPMIKIEPEMTLSAGAEFDRDFINFNSFKDVVSLDIRAENGSIKTWKVRLHNLVQLANSNFDSWGTGIAVVINPMPGVEKGWSTANFLMVNGTKPIQNGDVANKAAEMKTSIQSMPKNLIAAGTLFLGYFQSVPLAIDNPRSMTKFGVPFEAYPQKIKIDAKYTPGEKLQKSIYFSGSGIGAKYELETIEGMTDQGQIWVELIHWAGEGKLNYNGTPTSGVHVLSRGEHLFKGVSDWHNLELPLEKTAEYNRYAPTHLVIVMASSAEGHLFLGAKGSTLTVDNLELVY